MFAYLLALKQEERILSLAFTMEDFRVKTMVGYHEEQFTENILNLVNE